MCLLTTAPSNVMRGVFLNTPGMIEDVYSHNSDGLGAMYASKEGLRIRKILPKNAAEARAFIASLPNDDRQLALHWRMRTHGTINLDNCHPYRVSDTTYLAHNGILSTGNQADTTKSDTWHFIEDYLKLLSADAMHSEAVSDMIGDYIGDNRFAIMSADGRLTVINKDQGVEAKGVWFSNTYAWSPEMLGIKSKYSRNIGYSNWSTKNYQHDYGRTGLGMGGMDGGMSHWGNLLDDELEFEDDLEVPVHTVTSVGLMDVSDDVESAIYEADVEKMASVLDTASRSALTYLYQAYIVSQYAKVNDTELSNYYADVRNLLTAGKVDDLVDMVRGVHGAEIIAETLMWYCDVTPKEAVYVGQ